MEPGDTYWFSPRLGRKGSSTVDPWRLLPSPPFPLSLQLSLLSLFLPCSEIDRWNEGPASSRLSPLFISLAVPFCVTLYPPSNVQTYSVRMEVTKKKDTASLSLCAAPVKTEQGRRRWEKKMNEWLLALALLCTDTGRRGVWVCVAERDRRRGRRVGEGGRKERMGGCVHVRDKKRILNTCKCVQRGGLHVCKIKSVCVWSDAAKEEGCVRELEQIYIQENRQRAPLEVRQV